MNIELSPLEARIIGCLIEKEVTTPDYYPLTLNSLTTACNQKSNREPVLSLNDAEVQDAVEGLVARRLVSDESAFNSRVSKFQHRFCNTEFGDLKLTEQELGLVCCMLLRGAQTPGELRTRTARLCHFTDVKEVEAVLDSLASRESGALVVKLPREAGKRESRYQHLFSGEVDLDAFSQANSVVSTDADTSRIDELEQEVNALKTELEDLRTLVESLI
ncbi:YceH family protein [Vibrio aestuarianus]|uniref:YceH family protein n=1 Tax=Vibrio aestuarianus TaxID=28171 RepID=A0A9X4F7R3_9VIBR|nr:YceH family protein [Vibrio aestuarianus]MDE1230126.1 YceH family protein [Vibrio aestuarianus]MDE1234462.1 YceH family protein [Vibrio aestuarianus]MDE1245302.1 YceH family protein [Vibrio aestuarianus]MDE1328344.1 YceH family protein [Vibrio aestuarianus]MDE1345694.1 YceH family protein [Vibrio aestuarianus]